MTLTLYILAASALILCAYLLAHRASLLPDDAALPRGWRTALRIVTAPALVVVVVVGSLTVAALATLDVVVGLLRRSFRRRFRR
jgi:hypothetical protein